jgi:hypothetical protein
MRGAPGGCGITGAEGARRGERFRFRMSLPLNEGRELPPEDREDLIEGFRKGALVT